MNTRKASVSGSTSAASLFEFLVQLVQLRTRSVRDVAEYSNSRGDVLWFHDLPGEPEIRSALGRTDQSDEWLAIRRPRQTPPPPMPDPLGYWTDSRALSDPEGAPVLADRARVPVSRPGDSSGPEFVEESVDDHPEIKSAWAAYQKSWLAWAAERRRIASVVDVYGRLFGMHQRAGQLGEQYEIVVAVGLLHAKISTGVVRRHLLTRRARVLLEEATGRIAVIPDEDSAETSIEMDMLDAEMSVPSQVLEAIRLDLETTGTDLLDLDRIAPALERWINAATPSGYVDGAVEPVSSLVGNESNWIQFAPAIILRPRSHRSLVTLYRALIDQLNAGVEPPQLVRGLVEIMEPELEAGQGRQVLSEPREVYFPLPANDEQLRIVDRLRTHKGVVVVGPPGTGKSHTIANIVSDALAHGKRVVVTSHTPRALEVLVDKLPPDIRDLCVIMAGEGRGVNAELRRSVDAILQRSSDPEWTTESASATAERVREALARTADERAEVLARRRALRVQETEEQALGFGGYTGTLARIAERLASERDSLGWLTDEVRADPPVTDVEATEWLDLERRINGQVEAIALEVIPSEDLVVPAVEFAAMVEEFGTAAGEVSHAKELESDAAWSLFARADPLERRRAKEAIRDIRRAVEALDVALPWVAEARGEVLRGLELPWEARVDAARQAEQILLAHLDLADSVRVTGLSAFDLRKVKREASELRTHLSAGGSHGFGPFKPQPFKAASSWLKAVAVDGARPDTVASLNGLVAYLECALAITDLLGSWGGRLTIEEQSFRVAQAIVLEVIERLEPTLALEPLRRAARQAVTAVDGVSEPDWADIGSLRRLEQIAGALDAVQRRDEAEGDIKALAKRLAAATARPGVAGEVGILAEAAQTQAVGTYAQAYAQLEEKRRLASQLLRRNAFRARVSQHAPRLALDVAEEPDGMQWPDRLGRLSVSWSHSKAAEVVRRHLGDSDAASLDRQLARLDDRTRLYTSQLGATLAWSAALARLTQYHKAHLEAYKKFMAKYGKGTGKYAATNLAHARESMNECIDAVPAWIMPTYRLADTLTPRFEPFDIAIIDEASQSGVESLFILALAKQVVVVGDDQQISPDAVGVSPAAVSNIAKSLIPDLPLADLFAPDVSIFDQAQIRYPGKLQLREHFRCMPEIIAFSNRLSYASAPLEPVRQFGMDRLPPLRAEHVPGAEEVGGVNRREAEALVDKLVDCAQDPAYRGASMGVISLTGDRQAAFIQRLLIERLGPEKMLEHRIKCGDAYAFQGDQRRVMFLSMVASPTKDGHRLPAQTAANIQQRFNVAASRAEDQEWLFHSVTPSDLNPVCLRARLLAHFLDPMRSEGTVRDVSTVDLQHPFESLFEQRVCRRLLDRGYPVVPQHKVLNYRIDLVVMGGTSKLAVECDGDAWHGPEQYERDLGRQRDLERCGWQFVRIAESAFYLDPDEALTPVWEALDRLGIVRPELVSESKTAVAGTPEPWEEADAAVAQMAVDRHLSAPAPRQHPADSSDVSAVGPGDAGSPTGRPTKEGAYDGTLMLEGLSPATGRRPASRLAPYRAWEVRSVSARALNPSSIRSVILEITNAEGPVVVRRVAELCARAMGVSVLSRAQRSAINQAVFALVQTRQIKPEVHLGDREMASWTIRSHESNHVVLRERGPRALQDIPASEVRAAANVLEQEGVAAVDMVSQLANLYHVSAQIELHRRVIAEALAPAHSISTRDRAASVPDDIALAIPQGLAEQELTPHQSDRLSREFADVTEQTINDALQLGTGGLKRLGGAWKDGDDVAAARLAVLDHLGQLGVGLDEHGLATRIREGMPNTPGEARGATLDLVLARFAGRLVGDGSVALLMAPWKSAFALGPEGDSPASAEGCEHGAQWGYCIHVGCPGRYLGSSQADTDWRNNG